MRRGPLLTIAVAVAFALGGACATYTVVGLDGGDDASTGPVPTTPTTDASVPPVPEGGAIADSAPVDAADAAVCIACGGECCYAGTAKDHCRFGNVCGSCSATAAPCSADVDCCDAGKCTTNRNGDGGLCRATCKGRFGLCGSTNDCCLPLRCEENGSLTLCQ